MTRGGFIPPLRPLLRPPPPPVTSPRPPHHAICTLSAPPALPHTPVLLTPLLNAFSHPPYPIHTFLDLTVGAGGHAFHLLSHLPITHYIAVDKDPHALALAKSTLAPFPNVTFIHGDFRTLPALLRHHCIHPTSIDAALLDAGVSSMQLDTPQRGFSFLRDGPLDMRMDPGASRADAVSAAYVVNHAALGTLARIFREYGEERDAMRIARALVKRRETVGEFETTAELAEAVVRVKGWRKKGGLHPATLVFQALRIAVNSELEALEVGLPMVLRLLREGGRFGVISFHSLEDRVVKQCFRQWAGRKGGVGILNKKPIVAADGEVALNVRSRSAKLRVVQKLGREEEPWGRKVNKYARVKESRGGV